MGSSLALDEKFAVNNDCKVFARETPSAPTENGKEVLCAQSDNISVIKSHKLGNNSAFLSSCNQLDLASDTQRKAYQVPSCTTYVLRRDKHLESNVEHWINNDSADTDEEMVQQSQWQRCGTGYGQDTSFLSSNRSRAFANYWTMLNTVNMFAMHIKQVFVSAQTQVSRMAFDKLFHDCFAFFMEILMSLHAFVFMVLSLYQASTIV